MNAKEVVSNMWADLMSASDPDVIQKYVHPDYRQHSPYVRTGPDGLRHLLATLRPDYRYELVRIISQGDLVVLHGVHHNWLNDVFPGGEAVVGFDMFRVKGDQIAEHWDASVPLLAAEAAGRGQLDGTTTIASAERTAQSREIGEAFVRSVLIGQETGRLPEFIDGETLVQHIPGIEDGIDALHDALTRSPYRYEAVHNIVAEGDFVAVQSGGLGFGKLYTFWDLFRIGDSGRIVEQWQVAAEFPDRVPHGNGRF